MAMTWLTTNTSVGGATSVFNSGIDSTYKLYVFKFYDVNPATDEAYFTFQANATDTADYNDMEITSTWFSAYNDEAAGGGTLAYNTSHDWAGTASFQRLTSTLGNGGDESCAGELFLFNPSSTTYVKHWNATTNLYGSGDQSENVYVSGYFNDTTAIDDVQFKMSTGNMDAVIKMYGVS